MKISLKLIATYRKFLPEDKKGNTIELDAPEGATVEEVLARFGVPMDESSVILVNGHIPKEGQLLSEGDVIMAFPAMAGG
jgi:molybdopterin converting factor small subunit